MTRFFDADLDSVANFWRVFRRDGVTLGFTSHDRDLVFDGVRHRSAPGIIPSAIRRNADLSNDSAEVEGALSHDSIDEAELASGLFDGASVEIGAVNWETLESIMLYSGITGTIEQGTSNFVAELRSAKIGLESDLVPRTSPTCRARFCGHGCTISATRFTHQLPVMSVDIALNTVRFSGIALTNFIDGEVRFTSGPQTGLVFGIIDIVDGAFALDRPIAEGIGAGTVALVREGCDHTLTTCQTRFGNAVNFQGEPFLPGNDQISRYPMAR